MKNVSTYLNVISTVLFLGAFIALLFKPTIKQYKYIVMAYAAGVIATILGDIINIVIGPHVMNYFLIVYYVLIVVVDGALTAIAVMLFKAYLKAYQMYEEWEPVDKEQEWVLAEVGAVEYGGVPRTQFVSEAVPLKKAHTLPPLGYQVHRYLYLQGMPVSTKEPTGYQKAIYQSLRHFLLIKVYLPY